MPVARYLGGKCPDEVERLDMRISIDIIRVVPVDKTVAESREIDQECYYCRGERESRKRVLFIHLCIISKKGFESQQMESPRFDL